MMDLFQIGVDIMSTSVSKTTRKILASTCLLYTSDAADEAYDV